MAISEQGIHSRASDRSMLARPSCLGADFREVPQLQSGRLFRPFSATPPGIFADLHAS